MCYVNVLHWLTKMFATSIALAIVVALCVLFSRNFSHDMDTLKEETLSAVHV